MFRVGFLVSGALCAGLLLTMAPAPAAAQSAQDMRAFRSAFGNCGATCVVRYSPGGEVAVFQAAARAVRAGGKRLVVIDGPCISACAIFADIARSRVCITPRASFSFHKARVYAMRGAGGMRLVGQEDPPHSRDISAWVRRNGGFPARGLRTMTNRQAASFFRRCTAREMGRRA